MPDINVSYGRDFDLNLLRVFVVVAESGSVTRAAQRLYLTQPAVSAALRRLQRSLGARLFARSGRGLVLTRRGERLLEEARPHLTGLLAAALEPARFDPRSSEHTIRLGVSDSLEGWLLPTLLRTLAAEAPLMRLIVLPVQFRTVGEALSARSIDAAVTVADELPASIRRRTLFHGGFVCLFDPRARPKRKLTEAEYFSREHVVVSYNGDLRGVVEDALHKQRRVRCALASFAHLGELISGTALLATVPALVAAQIQQRQPELRATPLPFALGGAPMELLWPLAVDGDEAARFVRELIVRIAVPTAEKRRPRVRRRAPPPARQ